MQQLTDELEVTLTRLTDLAERAKALVAELSATTPDPVASADDHRALDQLVDDMGALEPARELARTYLRALHDRVDRVLQAFADGDEVGGVRHAGELASTSSLVGADAVRRCCRDIISSRSTHGVALRVAATATESWLKDWLAAT